MLDKKDLVAIRDTVPADRNFILATFLRGLYYGDTWFRETNKAAFMKFYHGKVEQIIDSLDADIRVACLKDDPEVILGYSILSRTSPVAHWVFVKAAWRHIGIAKSLVPNTTETVTHLTATGLSIIRKNPGVEYNPFILN